MTVPFKAVYYAGANGLFCYYEPADMTLSDAALLAQAQEDCTANGGVFTNGKVVTGSTIEFIPGTYNPSLHWLKFNGTSIYLELKIL